MSNEIIKVLDDLSKRFGIAIDWSSANIMPYLQDLMARIVKYETYTSIVWLVLGAIILLIGLYFIRKAIKFLKSEEPDSEIFFVVSMIITIFSLMTGPSIIFTQIDDIIEINTIPEKYIIEQIQYYKN